MYVEYAFIARFMARNPKQQIYYYIVMLFSYHAAVSLLVCFVHDVLTCFLESLRIWFGKYLSKFLYDNHGTVYHNVWHEYEAQWTSNGFTNWTTKKSSTDSAVKTETSEQKSVLNIFFLLRKHFIQYYWIHIGIR